jgi:hypothetical protein
MCFLLCGTECARGFCPSASHRHGVVWPPMLVACAGTVRSTGDRLGRPGRPQSLPTSHQHAVLQGGQCPPGSVPPSPLSMQASLCACAVFPVFLPPTSASQLPPPCTSLPPCVFLCAHPLPPLSRLTIPPPRTIQHSLPLAHSWPRAPTLQCSRFASYLHLGG